jgi:predicted transcriptional regulator
MKKPISVGIPENLSVSLDELAKKMGRKKNLIVAASLNSFLKSSEDEQERIIRKYLELERTRGENP